MKFDAECLASCPHLCLHAALGADCRPDITHESNSMKPLSCPMDFHVFVGLAYYQEGKEIVCRFIIEYSSLRDLGLYVIDLFLYEDFQKIMIFWL